MQLTGRPYGLPWGDLAGCPKKFARLTRFPFDGMTGQVLCSGDQSAAFAITNGVKQGYVLAPVLFISTSRACWFVMYEA